MRLLIVEDYKDMAQLLKLALSEHCLVSVVDTAQGAINLLISNHYDFILIDITLREGTGFEVAEFISNQPAFQDCHLIFVSGDKSTQARYRALNLRADDFIVKPIDIKELVLKIVNKAEMKRQLLSQAGSENNGHSMSPDSFRNVELFSHMLPNLSPQGQQLARLIMKNRADHDFNLEKAASEIGMSKRSLHRRFKEEFGESFIKVLIKCRLEHAYGLLESGYPVSHCARDAGFGSVNHFSYLFVREFGLRPKCVRGLSHEAGDKQAEKFETTKQYASGSA